MAIRRLFSHSYKTYKQAVGDAFNRKNLIYTNILISMGISTVGDMSEQSYELYKEEINSFDLARTAQMAMSGFTAGILCHHWYNFLDTVIVGRTLGMVFKKLMLDQFICSPILLLSFFATVAVFEDDPIVNFTDEVKDKFWTLYKAEWVVWPPAQIINFYFLPRQYRVLYDSTISLGYDIYASHIKHDKMQTLRRTLSLFAITVKNSKTVTKSKELVKVAFSDKFLIYTNVSISVSLSAVGDSIEQAYEMYVGHQNNFDMKRTLHMACSGAAVGVLCHNWYKVLDKKLVGKSFDMVMKKLTLDQIIFSPIMIVTFFGSVALFEKNPWDNFKDEVADKFSVLYKAEWMVWPPAQIINFYFLPTRYRVLYDNTISLGYDVYTSQVKHNKSLKSVPKDTIHNMIKV